MRNVLKRIFELFFVRLLVFELWSVLHFAFVVHSGLGWIWRFIYVTGLCPPKLNFYVGSFASPHPRRELCPQAPNTFEFNPPSQLVHGYHWFAFLNKVLGFKNLFSPEFSTNVEWQIIHISKTDNCTKKIINSKIRFRTLCIF